MAERKRSADRVQWENFNKKMKEKKMLRKQQPNQKKIDIGTNIVNNQELIVQSLEGEPSGKAKKYERTGPQEFVPFEFEEVSIDNIKEACMRRFASRLLPGMICDVLATDRGPSCLKMDHLPNVKLIHVRFMKSSEASGFHGPSMMSFSVASYRKSVQGHKSAPSSSSVLPEALKNQASIFPKSLPVSKMLQLGRVVTNVQKRSEMVYQSYFILETMEWGNPTAFSYYVEDEPFARGAFRAAFKAKTSPNISSSYVIKKYLLTFTDLLSIRHLLSLYALSKTKHTSHRSFFQFLIILSGDVSLNPGPVRHPCSSCLKPVAKNHRAILCDNCDLWAHIKCETISTKIYAEMANSNKQLNFICSSCILNQLPFPEGFMIIDEESQVTSTQKDFSFLDDDMDELKTTRGLKIAHLNTNGLLSKLDYLKIMLNGTFFDIFAVSETKLDANILDDEIKIDGYVSYRLDRNRHGGGVLFYVNNQLESHLLKHLTDSKYESLWIKVCLDKTKPIFLSVVYRPPSKGSDLESTDQLCAYLKECDSKLPQIKEVFICGDFNCNMMSRYALSSKIKDLCSSLSLKQLIEEPTRVTPHSSTLLDLIMTNSVNISKAGVIDPGVSDHSLVYVIRKFKRPKGEPKIIRVRSFKNFVDDDFLRDLRNSDWSYFLNFTDLDQSCDIFNSIVKTVADKHAPFVTHKIKGKIEAWVTNDLLQAIKERNYFKKKANQTKSIIDWNNFTQKRNQVNNMKNTLKQDYFNTLLTDNAKRPKQLWKTLKTLVPNGKNTTTSVKRLVTEDGIDVTCPKGIADHFNNFFVNVGVTLASKFSTDTSKVNPPVSEKLFNFSKTNTKCVQDHIKDLKNGKATGLDGIGSRILKAGAPVLSIYLSKIFNCSLATGYVPKCWKIKRVSPVHKGDVKTDPSNFRPISILPIPMKIFEKIVHDQVSTFIKENSFLNDRQSGFRKLFSTTTAVLDVSENILEQLDKNNFVGAVLIDLKKAFDTVDHKILLKKLWCYGFQNQSFDWFESYLTDRQQLTLVNNIMSDLLHEDVYGVPQGSVLGPLLFLLYIDDIKSVIQNAYCHLYADDTIILKGASDPDSLIAYSAQNK